MDPSGLGPDADPFRFVGNDPTNETDPSGLFDLQEVSDLIKQKAPAVSQYMATHNVSLHEDDGIFAQTATVETSGSGPGRNIVVNVSGWVNEDVAAFARPSSSSRQVAGDDISRTTVDYYNKHPEELPDTPPGDDGGGPGRGGAADKGV